MSTTHAHNARDFILILETKFQSKYIIIFGNVYNFFPKLRSL